MTKLHAAGREPPMTYGTSSSPQQNAMCEGGVGPVHQTPEEERRHAAAGCRPWPFPRLRGGVFDPGEDAEGGEIGCKTIAVCIFCPPCGWLVPCFCPLDTE